MKIGVLLKQTPDTEAKIRVKADASGIEEGDVKWVVNPYDEYAVEGALRLKEALGAGEVVIFSVGSKRAVESMRQALAMGGDRGVHVLAEGVPLDGYVVSQVLAKAVKEEQIQVLFAGKQAIDDDAVQVAHGVASLLEWPCVWPIDKMSLDGDKQSMTCNRSVGGGVREVLEVKFPAVICCDKGEHEPRYASLPGIMKAKSKPVKELKFADLIGGESVRITLSGLTLPAEKRASKMLQGDPEQVADQLIKLLREEAKVI